VNDNLDELKRLSDWILTNLGDDVPLHFTAFHPDFKLLDKPATPPETLHKARRIAMSLGLKYVYEGNIFSDGGDTICPGCRKRIIRRSWHSILANEVQEGKCVHCGTVISGVFTREQARQNRSATSAMNKE
jgi:pyruvate formate lyase activating enzyme